MPIATAVMGSIFDQLIRDKTHARFAGPHAGRGATATSWPISCVQEKVSNAPACVPSPPITKYCLTFLRSAEPFKLRCWRAQFCHMLAKHGKTAATLYHYWLWQSTFPALSSMTNLSKVSGPSCFTLLTGGTVLVLNHAVLRGTPNGGYSGPKHRRPFLYRLCVALSVEVPQL